MKKFSDYFWANVVFWAFLSLLTALLWTTCQEPSDDAAVRYVLGDTFKFMLLLFGGGFTVVSLFDAAYDYFAGRAEGGQDQGKQP